MIGTGELSDRHNDTTLTDTKGTHYRRKGTHDSYKVNQYIHQQHYANKAVHTMTCDEISEEGCD